MSLAYLISAHTDAPQLARLILALHKDAEFFVHIDKKVDIRPFQQAISAENVHFIEKRIDIQWGNYTQVEYQMALLEAAVNHPTHFDHLFSLSGLDYPLWSNAHITQWLEKQGDKEILQGFNMNKGILPDHQRELYTQRRPLFQHFGNYGNRKLSILGRKVLTAIGIRKPLTLQVGGRQWDVYKGASWWCISEELARYVLKTYQEQPAIRAYFKDSFGPDELLIQTIVFNSPEWAPRCMLTEGVYPGLDALTPLHYIVYKPTIRIMQTEDFPALMGSGKMFARKFVSGVSDEVVKKTESVRG